MAHCLVAEISPIGASIHTYNFLPLAFANGTSMPQSRSRVMERGCRPDFSHDLHCPKTFTFHSPSFSSIHCSSQGWYLSSGKNQCLVGRNIGGLPLRVECGLIKSVGFNDVPQFSH